MTAHRRYSFLFKIAGALLLVAVADSLFFFQRAGATLGLFAGLLLALVALLRPQVFASWPPRCALAAAALFVLALAADPSLLALGLYWIALTLAAMLPRAARFDDGWRWFRRLFAHGIIAPFGLLRDQRLARQAGRRRGPAGLRRLMPTILLPLLGTLLFTALFAQANPLISDVLERIDLWPRFSLVTFLRLIFWSILLVAIWSVLRPSRVAIRAAGPGGDPARALPGVSLVSITLSLLAFNALFALQNGLDLAFLWSGAPLPAGMTLAEYAHRGAYPLIATALLAGLFVLVTLRPGSPTAASRPIRLLVSLWIAQNLLLVASTMLRTVDYVDAYSLTRLRIAALIWMALVAVGLALICYRLLRGRSAAWLINANLLAALLVLGLCSAVDLGRMAAAWNVRHAREVGGRGTAIDLCYLNQLGASALLPLIELESRPLPPELRDRVGWVRTRTMDRLAVSQADWHGWTWRGARRLAAATALVEARSLPHHPARPRRCDGRPFPPPATPVSAPVAPPPAAAKPLTAPAER